MWLFTDRRDTSGEEKIIPVYQHSIRDSYIRNYTGLKRALSHHHNFNQKFYLTSHTPILSIVLPDFVKLTAEWE
jgi:hypothetical protein